MVIDLPKTAAMAAALAIAAVWLPAEAGDGGPGAQGREAHPLHALDLFDTDGDGAITGGDAFLAGDSAGRACAPALAAGPAVLARHIGPAMGPVAGPAMLVRLHDRTCDGPPGGDERRAAPGLRP